MDERQQQQVNEAAEKFASAIKDSYQALAERSVSAQELNAQLTQDFFNGVINNLRTQAENNRALAEDLIEQQRKQQEASQALTQESVNAYTDLDRKSTRLNSSHANISYAVFCLKKKKLSLSTRR